MRSKDEIKRQIELFEAIRDNASNQARETFEKAKEFPVLRVPAEMFQRSAEYAKAQILTLKWVLNEK